MARDYYAILGIPKLASEKEIRNAYRRLARQYHPDVNSGSKQSEARFKEINEAYQALSNPKTRMEYDSFGEKKSRQQPPYRGGNFTRHGTPPRSYKQYERSGHGASNPLGDLFAEMFRENQHGRDAYGHLDDLIEAPPAEISTTITLEEAYLGTNRVLSTPSHFSSNDLNRRIEVRIPRGVDNGSQVHVNLGGPSLNRKSLYIVITVAPHPTFSRTGIDLATKVDLPLSDAVLGGEVQVPTIKGTSVALKVPAETQNGQVFRLKGQGMPRLSPKGGVTNEQLGDLFVSMDVKLPTALNDEERIIFARLREIRPL